MTQRGSTQCGVNSAGSSHSRRSELMAQREAGVDGQSCRPGEIIYCETATNDSVYQHVGFENNRSEKQPFCPTEKLQNSRYFSKLVPVWHQLQKTSTNTAKQQQLNFESADILQMLCSQGKYKKNKKWTKGTLLQKIDQKFVLVRQTIATHITDPAIKSNKGGLQPKITGTRANGLTAHTTKVVAVRGDYGRLNSTIHDVIATIFFFDNFFPK